ncbi:TPA: hypothetical protein DEG21_04610 [Patescibacteria group bacterium]|nr:hypothetical protein [Candidatus Gracilibacteria bacterium]HBY75117.1 hypothetical protein [Candidatus Gracilibacteria bacterium]
MIYFPFCGVDHPAPAKVRATVGSVESIIKVVSEVSKFIFVALSVAVSLILTCEEFTEGTVQA